MAENDEKRLKQYPHVIEGVGVLKDIKSARKAMNKLYKQYARAEIDHETFRNHVYFFSFFINYLKTEKEYDVEKVLQAMEERLNAIK